jgi:hypothetical protein
MTPASTYDGAFLHDDLFHMAAAYVSSRALDKRGLGLLLRRLATVADEHD